MEQATILGQMNYPHIEIDDTDVEIIQLWQSGKLDVNLIMIEREKIPELIELLKSKMKWSTQHKLN